MRNIAFIIMAGGEGRRLRPLTYYYPKPLVRFGASGRIIDFTLNNCLLSEAADVIVLTQFLGEMIEDYLTGDWRTRFVRRGGSLRTFNGWGSREGRFLGTAHAVYETLRVLRGRTRFVVVLAGDHVYRMDYRPLLAFHQEHGKAATVAVVECDPEQASRFGIVRTEGDGRVNHFVEKPAGSDGFGTAGPQPLASMGVYVFDVDRVLPRLESAMARQSYDFGHDVFPELVGKGELFAYPFTGPAGRPGYWRDIGDLPSYWRAQMDLVRALADDADDPLWRPADDGSFIARGFALDHTRGGRTEILDSMIAGGVTVGASWVRESVIAPRVTIEDGAVIKNSVVLESALIKAGARVVNTVVEPGATIIRKIVARPELRAYNPAA